MALVTKAQKTSAKKYGKAILVGAAGVVVAGLLTGTVSAAQIKHRVTTGFGLLPRSNQSLR